MKKAKLSGHNFIRVESVDSTNNFAAKTYKAGETDSGTVIMADYQTEGKGQRGRAWQSVAGENITATLIYKSHSLETDGAFLFNIAISLAIANLLEDMEVDSVQIKWPNDILVDSKKIAGILIENSLTGNKIETSYIGIGFNVNQTEFGSLNATSLKLIKGAEFETTEILGELLKNIDASLYQLELRRFDWLEKEYLNRLFQLNRPFEYYFRDEKITASIKGIDENGKLLLEKFDTGELVKCNTQEIKYIF